MARHAAYVFALLAAMLAAFAWHSSAQEKAKSLLVPQIQAPPLPQLPDAPPSLPQVNPVPLPAVKQHPPVSSPWTIHWQAQDGKNRVTLSLVKFPRLQITCDQLEMSVPKGGQIVAAGNVKVACQNFEATCQKLSVPLDRDEIVLEGVVLIQKDSEMRAERIQFRFSEMNFNDKEDAKDAKKENSFKKE
ncbi:MAG: hypothetical protein L0Y70_04230 [Gemmataceae bacterium]|nr:hypothetical protein [Gemmataceae bacterium]